MNDTYTLCVIPRSGLEPGNESIQNEARLILTSKFVFVLVTLSTQQKHNMETISQNFMLRNDIVLCHLTYQSSF